eukprot:5839225-Pleurochrysis_carterae.AAC.1
MPVCKSARAEAARSSATERGELSKLTPWMYAPMLVEAAGGAAANGKKLREKCRPEVVADADDVECPSSSEVSATRPAGGS